MTKSLYIRKQQDGVDIALLEEKKLVEFAHEPMSRELQVGDLYLGKIKKLSPGLNAAFVDVGHEKDGFLHYLDLGPRYEALKIFTAERLKGSRKHPTLRNFTLPPELNRDGKISEVIEKGDLVLVQVVKEPISTKGPRLTSEISIPGRFMVLMPFQDSVTVSKKIKSNEERKRLRQQIADLKPKNYGFIVRTAGENQPIEELEKEIKSLMAKWEQAFANLVEANACKRILKEEDRATGIIRDLLNDSFEEIATDDETIYNDLKEYIHSISPDKLSILKLHRSKTKPLFEQYEIDRQLRNSFGRTSTFTGGAYIVIDHTEAMHVIDVNTGNRVRKDEDQETNVLNTNLDACEEAARQLRLRDMGGLVVIDFIDMKKVSHRRMVFDRMIELLKRDRATTSVNPISKFGLMELTRERVRPETKITVTEKCPTCLGTGTVRSSMLLVDEIENHLKYFFFEQNEKKLTLRVHPFLCAYFTEGFPSRRLKWSFKYGKWIKVEADPLLTLMEYRFFDGRGEAIVL